MRPPNRYKGKNVTIWLTNALPIGPDPKNPLVFQVTGKITDIKEDNTSIEMEHGEAILSNGIISGCFHGKIQTEPVPVNQVPKTKQQEIAEQVPK